MSTSTLASPALAGRSWTTALRIAVAAVAIVLLTALAFAVGRSTVSTHRAPQVVPAQVSTGGQAADPRICPLGHAC
jgi:hypothetical protein